MPLKFVPSALVSLASVANTPSAEPKPVPKLKPRPVRPAKVINDSRWSEYRYDYSGLY